MTPSQLAVMRHLEHMRQRGLSETTIYSRRRLLSRLMTALPCELLDATAADDRGDAR